MNFKQKLEKAIKDNDSLLCIGLDSDADKIPKHLLKLNDPIFEFNKKIVDKTFNLVCSYKLNIAYYSAAGISGIKSLQKTIDHIHSQYTDLPVILDAKRADIGSTSEKYAEEVFDAMKADAVTVNPYFGLDSIEPFLKREDKGIIILCRTSNPSASDFQDLKIENKPLYIKVAKKIVDWDKKYKNCLMVVGATWPEELKKIREIAPNMFFLVPGIGTQGGDLQKILEYGLTKEKSGLIIHVARAIIYSTNNKDFAKAARLKTKEMKGIINNHRK